MRKKKQKQRIVAIVVLLFLAIAGIAVYEYTQIKTLNENNAQLQTTINSNMQTVYVATVDIEKGSVITTDNVEMRTVYTGLAATNYITTEDLGTTAIVDISADTPVMAAMVTSIEVTNDLRDYEIASVNLATTQDVNDVIDVRITFPDGSDFIVLSEKTINAIDLENCVFSTYLNEEEILRFTCAMVDAYTTTGARLYTTRYIESNIQESATPTYPVSEVVKELIASDPNVVSVASETLNTSARINLESRLGLLSEEYLNAVNEGFGLVDTAKTSSLQAAISGISDEDTEDTLEDGTEVEDESDDSADTEVTEESTETVDETADTDSSETNGIVVE